MIRVGRSTLAMTFATVNVFPDPVTPSRTCDLSPRLTPSANCLIASGWSPVGLYLEVNLYLLINAKLHNFDVTNVIFADFFAKNGCFALEYERKSVILHTQKKKA